jgi:hypothetical protein
VTCCKYSTLFGIIDTTGEYAARWRTGTCARVCLRTGCDAADIPDAYAVSTLQHCNVAACSRVDEDRMQIVAGHASMRVQCNINDYSLFEMDERS